MLVLLVLLLRPAYTMQDLQHSRYGHDPQRRLEHLAASCAQDLACKTVPTRCKTSKY